MVSCSCDFYSLCSLPIALSLHDKDLRVVDKTVGYGSGHSGAVKDVSPLCEWQIGRYDGGLLLMSGADDLEKQI